MGRGDWPPTDAYDAYENTSSSDGFYFGAVLFYVAYFFLLFRFSDKLERILGNSHLIHFLEMVVFPPILYVLIYQLISNLLG